MAATLDLIFTGGTVSLTNGSPFKLDGGVDLSPSEVIRLTQRSPTQDGVTDQGFRLAPRVATLNLLFNATTDALLDSYRASLFYYFKPMTDTPLLLRYTRDDGTYRYLTCVAVDEIPIEIVPENRPGHLHRATVKLRAADPKWYSGVKTAGYTGGTSQVWWNAGGAISNSNVMEHNDLITGPQAWTYNGTITGSWSIVFRTVMDTANTHTAYHAGTGALQATNSKDARFYRLGTANGWVVDGNSNAIVPDAFVPSGTPNIQIVRSVADGITNAYANGTFMWFVSTTDYDIAGTTRQWRNDRLGSASTLWADPLEKAAVYDIALSAGQLSALNSWMSDYPVLGTIVTVNAGDVNEYPIITLQGPLYNPILVNTTTSSTIDLTGLTLGSSDLYTIDLRTGDKRIVNGAGSSLMSSLTTAYQLAAFSLAPSPVAAGGTNTITLRAGSMSTNTVVTVTYYDRYMSY